MGKKINIAKLLKDCPKGMELYSPIFGTVYFEGIRDTGRAILIDVTTSCNTSVQFYSDGKFNTYYSESEVTLFPSKSQRDWSKFQRPFKDGDIVATQGGEWLGITKNETSCGMFNMHCAVNCIYHNEFHTIGEYCFSRFATEEEKEKLFDTIKANGYKWNSETKTLEKLIEPKFKVGDKIIKRNSASNSWIVSSVNSDYYGLKLPNGSEGIGVLPISEQDKYELISTVPKFKVGDRIRHRSSTGEIKTISKIVDEYCFDGGGFILFSEQDNWELAPNKFDITTLKPFESKVLVRDTKTGTWKLAYWGFYDETSSMNYPYETVGGNSFSMCIPYEGNEHLFKTNNDCDDYYKTW